MRLLIVCLGNICRSPMAEGVLRARIADSGLAGQVELDSVGTGAWHIGQAPDLRAIATAARHGVDISGLRGRQLHVGDFGHHDWLLCADRSNLREVHSCGPASAHSHTALLLEWAGLGQGEEIPDPYTGDMPDFEHVWDLLERAAAGIIARLETELGRRVVT